MAEQQLQKSEEEGELNQKKKNSTDFLLIDLGHKSADKVFLL